jgi:NAD(P)-dependent dehydrogenase (short-subunit alcohol dehydrogenase family)
VAHRDEFSNKRAVVTGASSGIGAATAALLLQSGASVALIGRREPALKETVERAGGSGRAFLVSADISDDEQARRSIERAAEHLGDFDLLVNAAGAIQLGGLEATSLEQWDRMMNINLRSVFHLIKLAAPYLERSRGNIVNVSSVNGLRSFAGVLAYCVSKAGVDHLTRCAALDLAPKGIRVNAVNPGVVVTGLHRSGGMSEEGYAAFLEHSKSTHPLGRVGRADEIAELILFLASDKASWITGATISIDGGRALTCLR